MRRLFAYQQLGGELRKSEARYRTVLDAAFDAIVTITPDGIVRWFNRGAERIFGHSAEEIIGQPVTLLMPERYRELCVAGLHRYLQTGEARVVGGTTELVGLRKDGSEFPMEMSLGETLEVGERLFTGVIRDVTERKEAEKVIKESEERFRTLVQNTSDIITILEADGTVRYISPAVERVTGYKPEEQIGTNAFTSVHPDDRDRASGIFAEVLKKRGLHPPLEFRVPHKTGSWRYVEHIVNNRLDDPAVRGVVITSRDISDRRQTEEVLRRLNESLEQRVAVRTERLQAALTKLEESERGLRESERLYRTVVEQAAENIFLVDAETRQFLEANTAFYRSLGYTEQELLQMTLYDIVAHDKESIDDNVRQNLEKGRHFIGERRYRRKDGSLADVEVSVSVISYRGREALCIVAHDITERKRTERALIESERRFRQFFENSVDVLFVHDEQGHFVDCNAEACRALGYQREELLKLSVANVATHLISEEERREKKGESHWERAMRGEPGRIVGFDENELRRKDGSTFPVEVGVGAIEYGGRRMIFASARDISKRKQTEDALRESETKYRTLVEQIPMVTYIEEIDIGEPEWNMVYVSPQVQELLGYSPEEYKSKPKIWEELLHPDDRERMLAEDARTEKTGEPFKVQYRIFTRSGKVAWIRDEAILVRDEEGRPLFWQGVMYDITDQKLAEEEVRGLNEELEQRVRQRTAQLEAFYSELEAFSYSISHDLRAPLRAIDGFSQILLEDYEDRLDVEGKSYLRRVSAASRRMGQLIDNLLDLSRMTRSQMRRERVNLSALAQAIVEEFRNTQPEHKVVVLVEEGLVANGDESLLRAVLENLLGNAWKFTKNQPHPRIEFGLSENEDTPTYYVRDNGVGFDMAYADKLFGAFQRLHSPSEYEGTGIGLATVQRIIHRHGGRVWAKGEVGKGATFYFTL
jgi:PAS domain S-box-containing protein